MTVPITRRPPLAFAIVGLSFGAGLYSLVALRWLGFLGLPPVWFLTLLLVGMPVGGLLLVRNRWLRGRSVSAIIAVTVCLATAGALLFLLTLRWVDAHIYLDMMHSPSLAGRVFLRFLAPAAALFPLFVGYGLVELAAYRKGLEVFSGKSALVYALNLAGLCLAFLAYRLLLVGSGTSGLFLVGLACLLLAALVLEPRRWPLLVAMGLCVGLFLVPGREAWTVSTLEVKTGDSTLNRWRTPPNRVVYDAWTPHSRLTIVDVEWGIRGFYDGMYHWTYARGMPDPEESPGRYRPLQLVFSRLVRSGDRVAVLGAGGGLQVAAALRAGAERVVAVEVMPEVLEVLGGPLAESIEGTYLDPRVELVPKNARRFLAETDELFDVIVLASVETNLMGLRELFEPSQVMFTREALAEMKAHLAPGGLLTISKHTAVDWRGVIFSQVFSQLRDLGVRTRGYIELPAGGNRPNADPQAIVSHGVHYLIVAQNGPGPIDALATMDNILRGSRVETVVDAPASAPGMAITDDRAFATGMIIANLGIPAIVVGLVGVALCLLITGVVLAWTLRRVLRNEGSVDSPITGPDQISGRSDRCPSHRLPLAAVAVGINFVTIEYLIVYRLLDRLDVPMDATFLGMVTFVGLAAVGGLLLARLSSSRLLAIAAIVAVMLVVTGVALPRISLLAVGAAAFLAGSLFPRILVGPDRDLVRVYVWDAYGALWGGLAALLVPLFLGFSGQQVLAGLALLTAAWAVDRAGAARATDGSG